MDWELANFYLDRPGSLAQVFHFEVVAGNTAFNKKQVMFVDGLVFKSGRIRFNREAQIRTKLEAKGISLESLLEKLSRAIGKATQPVLVQA